MATIGGVLLYQLTKAVVMVAPAAFVWIVHGRLTAEQVVTDGGAVPGTVSGGGQVTLCIVLVVNTPTQWVGDGTELTEKVVLLALLLTQRIGGDRGVAAISGVGEIAARIFKLPELVPNMYGTWQINDRQSRELLSHYSLLQRYP